MIYLNKEQEGTIYGFRWGCEAYLYLEKLVSEFNCEPEKTVNFMINLLFPFLKKIPEIQDGHGPDLNKSPLTMEEFASIINSNDRNKFKQYTREYFDCKRYLTTSPAPGD